VRLAGSLAVLALAGCSNQSGYVDSRCPFVPGATASAIKQNGRIDAVQQNTNYELCLAKWGYALSYAAGSARDAAVAAAEACSDAVDMKAVADPQFGLSDAAIKQLPEPDYTAARRQAERRALFYVVAGRAGRCDQKK
jgi:hypothetical protein